MNRQGLLAQWNSKTNACIEMLYLLRTNSADCLRCCLIKSLLQTIFQTVSSTRLNESISIAASIDSISLIVLTQRALFILCASGTKMKLIKTIRSVTFNRPKWNWSDDEFRSPLNAHKLDIETLRPSQCLCQHNFLFKSTAILRVTEPECQARPPQAQSMIFDAFVCPNVSMVWRDVFVQSPAGSSTIDKWVDCFRFQLSFGSEWTIIMVDEAN